MRKSLLSQIAPFLLGAYAAGLLACAAYAFFTFSVSTYLPSMRVEFVVKRAFVLFMEYLIPLHAAAVAAGASLAGREPARGGAAASHTFARLVSSTLAAFILFTAAYTALEEGLAPRARARLDDLRYHAALARAYKRQEASAAAAGDWRAALDAADRYLAVDPGNAEMAALRAAAETRVKRQKPAAAAVPAGSEEESAQALVEKARAAFESRDWFAAHAAAQAALEKDPRREDARRLAADAWDKIGAQARAKDASDLFLAKKDAYVQLDRDPVAAYYAFSALAARYPRDTDIATYLAQARDRLRGSTFFLEDARAMRDLPGTQDILFLNRADAESTEAVFIGKMVEAATGETYFFDVEVIRYSAAGAVIWHYTAPAGVRQAGDVALLRGVDRADPAVQSAPTYLSGTRPEPDRSLLVLKPGIEELRALSTRQGSLSMLGVADLWRLRNQLGSRGLMRQAITVDMTMRMVAPFAFLIISILCVALGWAFRTRFPGKLPFGDVVLMPLVPAVMALFALLYLYAHRLIVGFTVLAAGFGTALVVVGALQLVLLAAALILMAGQSER
jgi:tetratricopeptide (TPR) repeat protein